MALLYAKGGGTPAVISVVALFAIINGVLIQIIMASRVFYGLANQYPEFKHLQNVANEHVAYSYTNLVGDSYEGGHWLGSFAIYTLMQLETK